MIACRSPSEDRPPSIFTPAGIGYGPRSLSSAYSNFTRAFGCERATTVIGIPIGAPSQSPEPKSGWRPVPAPIDPMIAAESGATGRRSTRRFHGFEAGKTGQPASRGSRRRRSSRAEQGEAGSEDGQGCHRSTRGYRPRTSSMNPASCSASCASSISSTFSAFCSPECERLKLPAKTVSSATVTFACM